MAGGGLLAGIALMTGKTGRNETAHLKMDQFLRQAGLARMKGTHLPLDTRVIQQRLNTHSAGQCKY